MILAAHGEPIPFGPHELNCPDVIPTHPNAHDGFATSLDARPSAPTSDIERVTP